MFEGKAARPTWWSRPEGAGAPGTGFQAEPSGPGQGTSDHNTVEQGTVRRGAPAPSVPGQRAEERGSAQAPSPVEGPGGSPEPGHAAPQHPDGTAPPWPAPSESGAPWAAHPGTAPAGHAGNAPPAPGPGGTAADTIAPGSTAAGTTQATPDTPLLPQTSPVAQAAGQRAPDDGEATARVSLSKAEPGTTMVQAAFPGSESDTLVSSPPSAPPTTTQPPAGAGDAAVPRFRPDPYGTPPYGRPGPYAPAPPVQHPTLARPTPARPTLARPTPVQHPPHTAHHAPWQPPAVWAGRSAPPPPPPRRRTGRLLAGAVLIAFVAGLLGGISGGLIGESRPESVQLPQVPAETGERDPDSVAGIAASTLPGVVYIHVKSDKEEASGTGFVIDDRGHILTNNHVVEPVAGGGQIQVTFHSGVTRTAEIVGGDSGYDLAVLSVHGVDGLQPLRLGNSDSVRVGDPVVAIGAPFDLKGTVTSGIISAKDRPITAGGRGDGSDVSYVNALQTDAPINPGNSGGPLVNASGEVIGVNSAIRSAGPGGGDFGEQAPGGSIGLGFAIPVNQAKRVAEELINNGKATHPVIGVQINLRFRGDGAKVSERSEDDGEPITPGGPADRAGIKPGDMITEVDGKPIHSGEELIVNIRSREPGDRMRLTLERDGDRRRVVVTLDSASGD